MRIWVLPFGIFAEPNAKLCGGAVFSPNPATGVKACVDHSFFNEGQVAGQYVIHKDP